MHRHVTQGNKKPLHNARLVSEVCSLSLKSYKKNDYDTRMKSHIYFHLDTDRVKK